MAKPSSSAAPFRDSTELREWARSIQTARTAFGHAIAAAGCESENDSLRSFSNALIQFWLAVGEANETIGHPFTQSEVKALTLSIWPSRTVSAAELRVIATSIAYQGNVRLAGSGAKDSRMDAAMFVAAQLEQLTSDDPVETVRKSIQRFRAKVRGQVVFWLDPVTLEVSHHAAESALLAGLPGKKGRPRRITKAD